MTIENIPALSVAIVGMACRFPGAADVHEFWQNLRNGVDSITQFTEEEMSSFGVRPDRYRSPEFIRAAAILTDADCFDAGFFGFAPKEAALMDPQHRVFLECAWEALESSGYKPDRSPQPLGVFAGTSLSSYLLYNILPNLNDPHADDSLQAMIGNDKDFLATRVSYKLNLHGPSIDVQTGCSTSLVAVHMACQSLLSYQCDMALAGGVSIQTPQRRGYLFQPGGLCSSDGHCRTFDADAEGTVFGSGVGVVVLRRLEDAIADRDHVIAVIRGSAVNNDGSGKLGYTAPSVAGQAEVIRTAQSMAQIEARSISYVECHGTATPLGDPAEITALTNAFRVSTNDTNFCAIGSVKTNVGHLDAAAGVAGLIKTALALENAELPPSLHYEKPNPQIDFSSTPFFVNSSLKEWPNANGPRRAGVSSFGIGGTNAHVVLEEASKPQSHPSDRPKQILCVSAKTPLALDHASKRLANFLVENADLEPANVAYTLQTGRDTFRHRRAVVCAKLSEAVPALLGESQAWSVTQEAFGTARQVIFMFPGGGSQYLQMGAGLYAAEPTFRHHLDLCSEILAPLLSCDLRSHLFPQEQSPEAVELMRGTEIGLPALFAVEYALAHLWMKWGLRPTAMIGHSLGEYTAACLSGVLTLEDALGIVATRARLMSRLSPGAMLSLPLNLDEVEPYLTAGLSVAAINGPAQTVVSGTVAAVENLERLLEEKEIESRRLRISVSSHSPLVDPILPEFQAFVSKLRTNAAQIPYISNLTGDWITPEMVEDKLYWVNHLRQTVQFHPGMEALLAKPDRIFLEVGPANALTTLAQALITKERAVIALPSMRHPYDQETDESFLHRAAARLWAHGAVDDWLSLYRDEFRMRIPLPTYPFERQRHWISPPADREIEYLLNTRSAEISSWFYAPGWRSAPSMPAETKMAGAMPTWLVFASDHPACATLIDRLKESGREVFVVGDSSRRDYKIRIDTSIHPLDQDGYSRVFAEVSDRTVDVLSILHMWNLTSDFDSFSDAEKLEHVTTYGLLSLSRLLRSFLEAGNDARLDIAVVSDRVFAVDDTDWAVLEKSLLIGPCRVIPQENPGVHCRLIDVGNRSRNQLSPLAPGIWDELFTSGPVPLVALRGSRRWSPHYPAVHLPKPCSSSLLRENGVYLIWGGTGEIGLEIARALHESVKARIAIVARHSLPPHSEWDHVLDSEKESMLTPQLRALCQLKQNGAEILTLQGDIVSEESVRQVTRNVFDKFGVINGVFHLAGATGQSVVHLVADADKVHVNAITDAKIRGVRNVEREMGGCDLDFVLQFSSTAAVLGGVGLSTYCAANAAVELAAIVHRSSSFETKWISVAWDAWLTARYASPGGLPQALREYAVKPDDAIKALLLLLQSGADGAFVVSTGNMEARYRRSIEPAPPAQQLQPNPTDRAPDRDSARYQAQQYEPPASELEESIALAWQEHLGVARVGREDKFFELGGNSLLALRIVSRLRKTLGMEIPIVSVFEGVCVRGMAEILAAQGNNGEQLEQSRNRGSVRRRRHEEKSDEGVLVPGI
jgi:phthiocerol/phenolphthiocerol synthesis type-I polyketide synthase E